MTQPYNDTLEAYEDMSEQISTLQAQRDELLAALEAIIGYLPPNFKPTHDNILHISANTLDQARSAIAKARDITHESPDDETMHMLAAGFQDQYGKG